jgi:hypothetical protein
MELVSEALLAECVQRAGVVSNQGGQACPMLCRTKHLLSIPVIRYPVNGSDQCSSSDRMTSIIVFTSNVLHCVAST